MRYIFGQFILDTDRHELIKTDELVQLRPRVFEVLKHLVINRERMVPKSELLENFWPTFVGEEVLNSCIMTARRAVGDNGRAQKKIKTIHGLGFRFIDEVLEEAVPFASPVNNITVGNSGDEDQPSTSGPDNVDEPTPERSKTGSTPSLSEFKTVTVLAVGIVQANDLAELLGPEIMHEFMDGFFTHTKTIMDRFGGTVTQWLGDGFVALFGAPVTHEDDARRAALAALELRSILENYCRGYVSHTGDERYAISAGLHTGPVIVGDVGYIDGVGTYTARGKATDRAAQLQQQASAGSLLLSDEIYNLLEAEVVTEPLLGENNEPAVHELLSMPKRRAGVLRRPDHQFSRFVGRTEELAILNERLSRTPLKNGQVVSISGAAGIGKSRLIREFCDRMQENPPLVLSGQCLPYGSSTPYLPLVNMLLELLKTHSGQNGERLKESAEELAIDYQLTPAFKPFLFDLLGIRAEKHAFEHLSPHERRTQTFELLYEIVLECSERAPLVLVVEDLHWIDATSEAWLEKLYPLLDDLGILVILTYRPRYQPNWLVKAAVTQLSLLPLKDDDSEILVKSIRNGLTDDITDAVIQRAEGNPFFLEELTHSIGSKLSEEIPDTVQAVLVSRIDQLDAQQKRLLQTCSVIGTPILFDVLQRFTGEQETELNHWLEKLEELGFLFEIRDALQRSYRFKHALTQDAAYRGVPKKLRKKLHLQIAEILENYFDNVVENYPEILALHHGSAGNVEAGITYWQRAARQAYERCANVEAVEYANRGLVLLSTETNTPENKRKELSLQLSLAPALMAVKGYGALDVGPVYERARALCEDIGDDGQLFRTLVGLWNYHWVRGEFDTTRGVADQLIHLAGTVNDPQRIQRAHGATGEFLFHAGDLQNAHRHLEQSVTQSEKSDNSSLAGKIPEVVCLSYMTWTLWHLGKADQSLDCARRAENLAREISHPLSLALCLNLMAEYHQFRLEIDECSKIADEAVSLSQTLGLPFWEGTGLVNLGWARAMDGHPEEGQRYIESGLEIFSATGARVQLTTWNGMLAEVHGLRKQFGAGLKMVDKGLDWANQTGELHYLSELHRVKGKLLLRDDTGNKNEEAESCFKRAIKVAQKQGAVVREVRARTDFADYLIHCGKIQEAGDVLKPQGKWLGKAEDGVDVRRARALIQALG